MPVKQFKEITKEVPKEFIKDKLEKETKEHKEKQEKEKHEKETKERKDVHKEHIKEFSKVEQLEVPNLGLSDPGAPVESQELSSASLTKNPEKYIAEKMVPEKIYKIEHDKHYKLEKNEHWEYVAGPVATEPGGPVEQRLAALEAAMAQLQHFIPQELRPDLSKGALKQEPAEEPAPKTEEKKK